MYEQKVGPLTNAMCKLVLQKKRSMRSAILSQTETKRLRRDIMSLDDCMIARFCLIDDTLPSIVKGKLLRSHRHRPKLAESEVITMEVVEAYLLISQDRALYEYYRRHYAHFFPALSQLHRSSFVRQAANWWALKELCWLLGLSVLKEAL